MPAIATEAQLRKRLNTLRITRIQFREAVADPLKRSMLARSPIAAAAIAWELPTEAAAAGWQMTMMQDESGWHVSLERGIDDETELHTAGDAKSLLKALFQLTDATQQQIEALEAEARRQLAQMERAANVAA